jgi:O-antigen ligase
MITSLMALIIIITNNFLQIALFKNLLEDGRPVMPFRWQEAVTTNFIFYLSALAIPVALYKCEKIKKNYIFFFFLFFIIFGVIITGDRVNTILSIVLILIFIYFYYNIKVLISYLLVVSFVLYILIGKLNYSSDIKIKLISRYYDFYNIVLVEKFKNNYWNKHFVSATNIWENNKYFGSGFRSFRFECSAKKYNENESYINTKEGCTTHPHNIYLEIISENGIFCLIFFIFFMLNRIYLAIKKLTSNLKLKNNIEYMALFSLLSYLLIYLFPIKSFGSFYNNYQSFLFWFVLYLIKKLSEKIYDKSK